MATPIVLVEHPAEHVLFDGALTCDVVLPAHFDTGARVVMQATSEALLKGLAIAEDVRGDDPDERKEATPTQQRIEALRQQTGCQIRTIAADVAWKFSTVEPLEVSRVQT